MNLLNHKPRQVFEWPLNFSLHPSFYSVIYWYCFLCVIHLCDP